MKDKNFNIYKIYFKDTPYVYIGKTSQFNRRYSKHLSLLETNKHANTYMQNIYNKHKDLFRMEIIKQCNTTEELNQEEVKSICENRLNTKLICLNILDGGEQNPVEKPEVIEIIRQKAKGKVFTKEHCANISKSKAGVYAGSKNPMYGMTGEKCPFWGRKHTKETKEKMRRYHLGKVVSINTRKRLSLAKGGKPICVYKDDLKVGTYFTQGECAKKLKVDQGDISRCLHGTRKTIKGYRFTYG